MSLSAPVGDFLAHDKATGCGVLATLTRNVLSASRKGNTVPTKDEILAALATVEDPEINKPITELGMVEDIAIEGARVGVKIKLTIPGCPLKDRITTDVTRAVSALDGVDDVQVVFGAMTNEERQELSSRLRADKGMANPEMDIPFAAADSKTKVIAVASGKGGVGKSTLTVNLAAALAKLGHRVGVLDADIWGYSIPRMFGVSGKPVAFDGMVMPLQAHGCKVISIGFFTDPDRSVIWRGPMLHRALQQFLGDVHWGDIDFLVCDLPPGTGDIAISLAQMLPNADMLVVTTPQQAAQKVALRAGKATEQTGMTVTGVIENMAGFTDPTNGITHDIFGSGGGEELAEALGTKLLSRIPIDPRLRESGDAGVPLVVSDPDAPAAAAIIQLAEEIAKKSQSLVGRSLPLSVS